MLNQQHLSQSHVARTECSFAVRAVNGTQAVSVSPPFGYLLRINHRFAVICKLHISFRDEERIPLHTIVTIMAAMCVHGSRHIQYGKDLSQPPLCPRSADYAIVAIKIRQTL